MTNPENFAKNGVEEEVDDEAVEEETEDTGDELDPEDPMEEDEAAHCSKHGCRYFLLTVAILYLTIVAMACYFMYLGRFAVLRGFGQVNKTYNSFTFSNLKLVVTGREPIHLDS